MSELIWIVQMRARVGSQQNNNTAFVLEKIVHFTHYLDLNSQVTCRSVFFTLNTFTNRSYKEDIKNLCLLW